VIYQAKPARLEVTVLLRAPGAGPAADARRAVLIPRRSGGVAVRAGRSSLVAVEAAVRPQRLDSRTARRFWRRAQQLHQAHVTPRRCGRACRTAPDCHHGDSVQYGRRDGAGCHDCGTRCDPYVHRLNARWTLLPLQLVRAVAPITDELDVHDVSRVPVTAHARALLTSRAREGRRLHRFFASRRAGRALVCRTAICPSGVGQRGTARHLPPSPSNLAAASELLAGWTPPAPSTSRRPGLKSP